MMSYRNSGFALTMINSTTTSAVTTPTNLGPSLTTETKVIAVIVCAIVVISSVIILAFMKCGLSKHFRTLLAFRSRSSSHSSHQRLHADSESVDLPVPRAERELFSIADTDDFDMRSGAGPDDGYFYDEIYERSAFVDELTNTSLKELNSNIFTGKIPDLNLRFSK